MNIYISRDGQQFGPYSPDQVREHLSTGEILPTDLAWHEGAADWLPVKDVLGGSAVLQGAAATASVACPKCGGALESDQVVCLQCGHNLDDPPPSEEEQAAAAKARFEANRVPIPLPLSYENETAARSAAVNSLGWGLIFGCMLPIFADAGKWNIPIYDMWITPVKPANANEAIMEPYTWQMMFDLLGPAAAGIACCMLATMMHGRGRGGVLLAFGLVIVGMGLAVPEVGEYKLNYRKDLKDSSTAIPITVVLSKEPKEAVKYVVYDENVKLAELKSILTAARKKNSDKKVIIRGASFVLDSDRAEATKACADAGFAVGDINATASVNTYNIDQVVIKTTAGKGNQFYEILEFDPGDFPALMGIFALAWVGIIAGSKVRFYRPESMPAYIMALVGAGAVGLIWLLPLADGILVTKAFNYLSSDPWLGGGLVFMFLMQLGAAVLCIMNRRGIRPSLMKKYSNLAGTMMMVSVLVPVLPLWGKVIYDKSNDHTDLAKERFWHVKSQFGVMYTGYEVKESERHMRKLEKPLNARIGSIFGWFATGAKYVAWLGGIFLLIPLAIVELICGRREPDGQFF